MPKIIDISPGERYNHFTVIKEVDPKYLPNGVKNRCFECMCDCGKTKVLRIHAIRHSTKSCSVGCITQRGTLGESHTKIQRVWKGILNRCYIKNAYDHIYMDRGISVCEEWRTSYLVFKEWALKNGYKEGLHIDRIDNDKGYCPENCRFVTPTDNCNNRRNTIMLTYNDITKPLYPYLRELGIHKKRDAQMVAARIKKGWDHHLAVDTPKLRHIKK